MNRHTSYRPNSSQCVLYNTYTFYSLFTCRSLSTARKTCSRLVEDCRRIADCDPLQALSEQEPLSDRAEAVKVTCEGLPQEPIISPTIHSTQQPGTADHLHALVNGLSVTMSLDPTEQEEEEEDELELVGPHAQDTQHTTDHDQSGVVFPTDMPKLDSAFPVDPSPSLASPDSYSTPLFSHHYSPPSSNSEDSTEEEFKALRLRPSLSILMGPPIPMPGYRPHQRSEQCVCACMHVCVHIQVLSASGCAMMRLQSWPMMSLSRT